MNLAMNAPSDAEIFTIDFPADDLANHNTPIGTVIGSRFRNADCTNRITQLRGDSTKYDFSFLAGTIEFVFIDGSHDYMVVRKDSSTALEVLNKNGGVIVWHDYGGFRGVTEALEEQFSKGGVFEGLQQIAGTSLAILVLDGNGHGPQNVD